MRGTWINWVRTIGTLGLVLMISGCTISPPPAGDGGDDATDGSSDGSGDGTDTGTDSKLAVFQDPESDFTSTDVYDVNDEIVQFDTENDAIIWAASGSAFNAGSWVVSENFPESSQFFQIRFGTKDGERRAFFTETGTATICDIRVSGAFLSIFSTSVTVPQE